MMELGQAVQDAIDRLRRRAHVHTDACYGSPVFNCADHHRHDDRCYERRQVCGLQSNPDLVLLFQEFDRMVEEIRLLEERILQEGYDRTHVEG